MTHGTPTSDQGLDPVEDQGLDRRAVWMVAGGFGMILVAALLLWLRFGAEIFNDALTALQNCF
jgi:hypothetical protein